LVVGDPFGATTHTDFLMRARDLGIEVVVYHNASIMNAVGACGLQLYRYGEAVSIVFFEENWRPDSFYDKIKRNRAMRLHTLCLLDIKVKEPNMNYMYKTGKVKYDPPRYMSVNTAVEEMLEVEEKRKEEVYSRQSLAVGLARVGCRDQVPIHKYI
jgi:diphthine methyl ester synthase